MQALQTELIDKLKDIVIDEMDDDILTRALFKSTDTSALKKAELEELNRAKAAVEKSLEHLYNDRLSEIISLEQYISYNKSYNKKLNDIQAKIFALKEELENDSQGRFDDIKGSVKKFLDTRCIDRELVEHFVDRIEFGEIDRCV